MFESEPEHIARRSAIAEQKSQAPWRFRRALAWISLVVLGLVSGSASLVYYLMNEPVTNALDGAVGRISPPEHLESEPETTIQPPLRWPDETLSGTPAKELLLRFIEQSVAQFEAIPGYQATLNRQERVDNKLGPEQIIKLKVRHAPFAIYMKFLSPDTGKEAIFAEGQNDNHVVAHGGGLTRLLLPHLKVPPRSRLALSGNRHPITEAGLLNLTRKLLRFRQMDLEDEDAETVLDRVTDSEGRCWLRSVHTHTVQVADRPFSYVEVYYDPETNLPSRIKSFDWPATNGEDLKHLAERYEYTNLVIDAQFGQDDFDYQNPAYDFRRF